MPLALLHIGAFNFHLVFFLNFVQHRDVGTVRAFRFSISYCLFFSAIDGLG